jgi:hypothetical protein
MSKKKKPIPMVLGVVLNPGHPAVAKFLAESGIDAAHLASAGMGAVVQVPGIALVNDAPPTRRTPRRIERAERGTPIEHAEIILDAFTDPNVALSVSQVAEITELSASQAKRGLDALRDNGQIFKGGDKRFARYGFTQKIADAEAARGRNLQESVQLYQPIRPKGRIVPEEGPGID